jgi:hypothetical protein
MTLDLRPNCEWCDADLAPSSLDARICSYECTFCATCVDTHLLNVCPNCGGGFAPRPVRPVGEWRPGISLARFPASTTRHHLAYDEDDIAGFRAQLCDLAPEAR